MLAICPRDGKVATVRAESKGDWSDCALCFSNPLHPIFTRWKHTISLHAIDYMSCLNPTKKKIMLLSRLLGLKDYRCSCYCLIIIALVITGHWLLALLDLACHCPLSAFLCGAKGYQQPALNCLLVPWSKCICISCIFQHLYILHSSSGLVTILLSPPHASQC